MSGSSSTRPPSKSVGKPPSTRSPESAEQRGQVLSQRDPDGTLRAAIAFESSAVPDPERAKSWESICPGAAQALLAEYQTQSQHIRDLERIGLEREYCDFVAILKERSAVTLRSQLAAGGICLILALAILIGVIIKADPWMVGAICAALTAIPGTLLYFQRNRAENPPKVVASEPDERPGH